MKKNEKPKQGVSRLLEISGETNAPFTVNVLLSICRILFQLMPYLPIYQVMAELLQHATAGSSLNTDFMIRWAVLGLIGPIVGHVLSYGSGMMAHVFSYRVICGVRLKVVEHIGKLPMGYVTNHSIGKIKQVLEADAEQIENSLVHQLPDLISTVVMLLAIFIIVFSQNIRLAFTCLFPIAPGFVCQFAVLIRVMKSGGVKENFDTLERISSSSIQYVQGAPSIKIFGQAVKFFQEFYKDIISYRDFTTQMTEMIRPGFVLFRAFVLSMATFLVPAGLLLYLRSLSDVSFVVTLLFFLILSPGAASLALKLRGFFENMNVITEGVTRVDEVLNEKPSPEPMQGKLPVSYDIEFCDVSFPYEAEGRRIPDKISFIARQGEATTLVGPPGAEKSTIAELIPRFWDVTDGGIAIGGTDARDMTAHDLMEQVSFVFQESFLFSDTISNNIALGEPGAIKEQVEQTAYAARCRGFITALLEGYQTNIGDGRVYLSGGEQQRISIAKAILKDAPILVLDEASAYADVENEHEVQIALCSLIQHKTVIMTAYRLTAIRNANQILVVDRGQIKEKGFHNELLEKHSLYADMWSTEEYPSSWTICAGKEAVTE